MSIFVVSVVCLRCGFINEVELGLTNKNDISVYKCDKCNFIVVTSWMGENENL